MGPGATRNAASAAVDAVLSSILKGAQQEKLHITRFGTFETALRPARTAAHPITGARITVPTHTRLIFRPADELIKNVIGKKKGDGADLPPETAGSDAN